MSWEATAWAAKQTVGTSSGKLLLLCLSQYADVCGAAWPAQGTLLDQTELGADTLRSRLNDLEDLGLIARFKMERENGGFTADMVVVLHDDAAHDYADYLRSNLRPGRGSRWGQDYEAVSIEVAKAYERPTRKPGDSRNIRHGEKPATHVGKSRHGMSEKSGYKNNNLNQSIEYSGRDRKSDPRGEVEGCPRKEGDDALRSACLAAERGDTERAPERIFVEYGTQAFSEWTRTYARLGLSGPAYGTRLVLNPATNSCSRRCGAYFPSERPPGTDRSTAPNESAA